MPKERACRNCHMIITEQQCPNCKSTVLSREYVGIVMIYDPENSSIAKKMGVTKKGKYALKVR
ncbi:MAG: transcription elongation factor subunit Spt4 [Candidatus Helarchaeota archaeon]